MQEGQTQTREEAHAKGDMQVMRIHPPDHKPSADTLAAQTHLCDKHDVVAVQHSAKELEDKGRPEDENAGCVKPSKPSLHKTLSSGLHRQARYGCRSLYRKGVKFCWKHQPLSKQLTLACSPSRWPPPGGCLQRMADSLRALMGVLCRGAEFNSFGTASCK